MRFCRRLICLALALALMAGALPFARATEYPFIGVTTDSLRLRAAAKANGTILLTMSKGSALLVTGETGDFYIVVYEGRQGYAAKSYIAPYAATETSPAQELPTATPAALSGYAAQYNGMSGSAARALQEALKELNFYAGKIDGKFGAGTENAVRAFQLKNGLTANGVADAITQQLLFEGKPYNAAGKAVSVKTLPPLANVTAKQGDAGELVEKIQSRLKELGHYTGAIDGDYGSGTVSAVKRFQRAAGINADGIANDVTQAALFAASTITAVPTKTALPTPTPTPASGTYPYVTDTLVTVNMRKGRTVASAYVQSVPKGASVTVQSMSGDYVYATYNGQSGYLNVAYVNIPLQYLGGAALKTDADAQRDYKAITLYATGASVKALQQALTELNYYKGLCDGNCGADTVAAIKQLQKINGLVQDGVASPEIQQLVFEKGAKNAAGKKTLVNTVPDVDSFSIKLNATGDRVTALQTMLKTLGYLTAAPNGVFDRDTYQAVRAFQKAKGLTIDGVAGPKTLTVLRVLAATPTPTSVIYLTPTPVATATPLTAANVIVMQIGTRGVAVTNLETRLVELGYYGISPDGIYDASDKEAVRAFQKNNNIKADGIAGLETQLLLYSALAVPFLTPTPDVSVTATPAVTVPPVTESLRIGSAGAAVISMQSRLITLGYLSGAADGIFGTGTAAAVTRFQRANNLLADGIAGQKTLNALYSASAVAATATATPTPTPAVTEMKVGDRGDAVKKMQQTLVAFNYLQVADGVYGLLTYNAVKAFQSRNGLTADGVAGKMTLTRLYSSAAIGAETVVTKPTASPSINPGTFVAPKASEVRYANWFSEIRARAKAMPDVIIYDPITGLHYNLHMFSLGKHADAEPPTAEDTAIMEQMIGYNNWTAKAVWVIFSDGRVYMASTHSHGHEVDHTSGNNLTGHVCLHFPRIMEEAEATGPYAVSHQKAILLGWEMTQAMID